MTGNLTHESLETMIRRLAALPRTPVYLTTDYPIGTEHVVDTRYGPRRYRLVAGDEPGHAKVVRVLDNDTTTEEL
jgi:hypothetical protein